MSSGNKSSENRFKKGIKSATSNTAKTVGVDTVVDISDNASDNASDNIQSNALSNIQSDILDNASHNILTDILANPKKERGKNHTFYLSADVGHALDTQVEKSGISKSELVDRILQKVLLNR